MNVCSSGVLPVPELNIVFTCISHLAIWTTASAVTAMYYSYIRDDDDDDESIKL